MSIYFLRHDGLIKIGFSSNLAVRIPAIIAGIPGQVEFLGHLPGDRELERHLHKKFEASRFSGEWFAVSDNLLATIRILADLHLPEPQLVSVTAKRAADADDAWKEAGTRFRARAADMFPRLNHGQRRAALVEMLGWAPRRVRSLYEATPGHTLRQSEIEALNEFIFASDRIVDLTPTGA